MSMLLKVILGPLALTLVIVGLVTGSVLTRGLPTPIDRKSAACLASIVLGIALLFLLWYLPTTS